MKILAAPDVPFVLSSFGTSYAFSEFDLIGRAAADKPRDQLIVRTFKMNNIYAGC